MYLSFLLMYLDFFHVVGLTLCKDKPHPNILLASLLSF
jgi:hypothetical protein